MRSIIFFVALLLLVACSPNTMIVQSGGGSGGSSSSGYAYFNHMESPQDYVEFNYSGGSGYAQLNYSN